MSIQDELRARARALMEDSTVSSFIAWESGRFENQTTPLVCLTADDTDRIVFNEYCVNTVGKYVLDLKGRGRVGIAARGCESRAINRMIQDNQLKREDVYIIGIPCPQMRDRQTGEILGKCSFCEHRNPPEYDELLGEQVQESTLDDPFAPATQIEELSMAERQEYFNEMFEKCIRCYACRDVCPCCTCRTCFVDSRRVGWQGKQSNLNENRFYGLTREFHVADRCIDCRECERVCPMGLPLMALNRKLAKDMEGLFGASMSGMTTDNPDVFINYKLDDVEEFM